MIFSDRYQVEMVRRLGGNDAQTFIDVIDEVRFYTISQPKDRVTTDLKPPYFDNQTLYSLPPEIHRICLRYLIRTCGLRALIPSSLSIPLCYDPTNSPLYRGGLADVWKGQHNGQQVVAKALRVYTMNELEIFTKVGRPQLVVSQRTYPVLYRGSVRRL